MPLARTFPGALAALALLSLGAPLPAQAWELVKRDRALGTEYRLLRSQDPARNLEAYRIEAELSDPIERVIRAHESGASEGSDDRQQQILRRDGDVTITYTYVSLPLVADRDLVLRNERSWDADAGVYRTTWRTVSDEGPEPKDGVVRIDRSEGRWEFERRTQATTQVIFESMTDVGLAMPAWLVNRIYRRQIEGEFERLLERLARVRVRSEP